MPQRDQVEKMRNLKSKVNQILTVTSILQVFCFARLVVSDRCRLKTYAIENLEQPTNTTRIRFWTFVQKSVEFDVSLLASPRKPKKSNVFVAMHV